MINMPYHTDDFYQRMLDLGARAMNSGTCQGGPLHGRPAHHPEPSYRLAVDQHTRRAIPGMVGSDDPFIKFGTYRFADGVWMWEE